MKRKADVLQEEPLDLKSAANLLGPEGSSAPKALVSIVQWNIAGVTSNPLEFTQSEAAATLQTRAAVQFVARLSEIVGTLIAGTHSQEWKHLADASLAVLLAPVVGLTKESRLAAALADRGTPSEPAFVDRLRAARAGEKIFGKADLQLAKRTFGFMKLSPANTMDFVQMLASAREERSKYWRRWLRGIESECREVDSENLTPSFVDHIAMLAGFEGIILEVALGLLAEKETDMDDFAASLKALTSSMQCDEQSKTQQLAETIMNVHLACRPDVFMFEEFNQKWLESDHFSEFSEDHAGFGPAHVPNPAQVTRLFIRQGGSLAIDTEATANAAKRATSLDLKEVLRPTFAQLFDEPLVETQLTAAVGNTGFLATRVALAVCRLTRPQQEPLRFLAAAAHAASSGTDNRALVASMKGLADDLGCELLLGLDSNSAAEFGAKAVAQGAAGQREFVNFLGQEDIRHCFSHIPQDHIADAGCFHTVRKCRSYLQAQLHKAMKPDCSAKDFIVCTGKVGCHLTGVRVNKPLTATHLHSDTVLPLEKDVWDDHFDMPTPEFASDHAMIVALMH
eukprot:gnl/TRDRNA2_/TRDRNA2_188764_c0_seq1.p1 gnl/TRDRNA2_/TRDRNA2_188764_c0~~gnl/TRDRNA2_/TRDRNA2_188764_c0_seq1.p1  ORF type:complete len:579 (-),score=133.23 gnl/TRDRNA2_/TRDRNA2_188764_c0_seq1:163-1863(-)